MRFFGYFWLVFALYFIVAHPAIIYYNLPTGDLENKSPTMALVYLGIALVGWTMVFGMGLRLVYRYTFGLKGGLDRLSKNGTIIRGEIERITKSKVQSNGHHRMEMVVKFNNFAQQIIYYTISVVDTKSHLKRYEVGKQVSLRVDKSLKNMPYVIIEGAESKLRPGAVALGFCGWAILLGLLVCYFMYAYQTESQGYGWRFLSYYHPLLMSLLVLLLVSFIGYFLIYKLVFAKMTGGTGKQHTELLLFGDRATAFVSDVAQTGTYINEQPEIRYHMQYTDAKGERHEIRLKKVVSLLSLHNVQDSTKKIFYLPHAPQVVAFEEDVLPKL